METSPFAATIEIKHQQTEPFEVAFVNVPVQLHSALALHLVDGHRLQLAHLCCASDPLLLNKEGLIFKDRICSGEVISDASIQCEILAYNLSSMAAAAVAKLGDHCIILYPTGCETWDSLFSCSGNGSTLSWLRYLIFKPSDHIANRLLVEKSQADAVPLLNGGLSIYHKDLEQNMDLSISSQEKTRYYLLFPNAPGASRMARTISQWLRTCYPRCSMMTNLCNGDWKRFQNSAMGTIIIHRSCVEYIHRLAGFASFLYSSNHQVQVLVLRTPMDGFCGFSFGNQRSTSQGITLQSIFSHGNLVLLTPSFLFSQPHRATWLLDTIANNPSPLQRRETIKLVAAGEVLNWLLEIAKVYTTRKSPGQFGDGAVSWDCARLRATLSHLQHHGALFLAPDDIHPDDEESLVNWFSWWSTSKAGTFRNFIVACSDSQHAISMTRELDVPNVHITTRIDFTRTISDVEEFLRRIDATCRPTPLGVWWYVVPEPSRADVVDLTCSALQWLNYIQNLLENNQAVTTSTRRNTFAALFQKEGADPWLAVYRSPPYCKTKTVVELFIFDCGKSNSPSDRSTRYAQYDLSNGQWNLLRLIKAHNKASPQISVWIGCPDAAGCSDANSMEKILNFLSLISDFEGLKRQLPLYDNKLYSRGWRRVKLQDHSASEIQNSSDRGRQLNPSDETSEQEFTVFDAPGQISAPCQSQNRFYRWCQNQKRTTGRFTYTPTRQWYRDQEKNGRGLGHLLFLNWADLASYFGVVEDNDRDWQAREHERAAGSDGS